MSDAEPTNGPRVLAPDRAPTPFTAAEIRDATRPGHRVAMMTALTTVTAIHRPT